MGPCAKQTVTATIVSTSGERFVGTNSVANPQAVCPRGGMPTGTGYEMCKSVCAQTGHAEENALRTAGGAAFGGVLYLEGHTYACDNCIALAAAAGVLRIEIGSPP